MLKKGITYPDGSYRKEAWEELERFKYVCKKNKRGYFCWRDS